MLDKDSKLEEKFIELRAINAKLQYQVNYLRQHTDVTSLPPAQGKLRELQLETVAFAKEIVDILKPYNVNPFVTCGALVGYVRHNKSFVPWDDNIDFGLMGKDYWRLLDIIRDDFILLDSSSCDILPLLDGALHEHPNKIIGFQTPNGLHLCKGISLENHINIKFSPFYYWNENSTAKDFLYHAKDIRAKKSQYDSWDEIFSFYKQELAHNSFYCDHSNKIATGIGSCTLTDWKFSGFYTIDQIFPLQNIIFENTELPTINNIEHHLKAVYGDHMQLPKDLGITVTSSVTHAYLQTQGRSIDMPEASVTCKHTG